MKKIKITTPENIEVEYTLADVVSRSAAALIDNLIQFLIIAVIVISIIKIAQYSQDIWNKYYGWIIGIGILVYSIINYVYFILMELTMNGMTIGKRLLKLRTIRSNGQPITLKHSAIRNLFRVFIDNYGIGIVMIFFSKERKRLGDLVASTIVVLEQNQYMPITLDNLKLANENLSYYITEEENSLLQDYFARRDSINDCSKLREEIRDYFKKKFEDLDILEEYKDFINQI